MVTIQDKCVCGHKRYDHYGARYNFECIHRMGRYTGKKCLCKGFTTSNIEYLEKQYEQNS
jgi:hypothetical protein